MCWGQQESNSCNFSLNKYLKEKESSRLKKQRSLALPSCPEVCYPSEVFLRKKKFKEISILDLYHVVVLSLLQLRFQVGQENSIGLSAPGCTAQKEPSKLLLKTNFRVLWYS